MTEYIQDGTEAKPWVRFVNHYDDQSAGSHPTREEADRIAGYNEASGIRRIACVINVFCEGDGLKE